MGKSLLNTLIVLGDKGIIKGLEEALTGMKAGETKLVVIPSDLAYGQGSYYSREIAGQKRLVISPGEPVILEIKVNGIK